MKKLLFFLCLLWAADCARVKRQGNNVGCSACIKRSQETPNMSCCRCVHANAFCNNDLASPELASLEDFGSSNSLGPGLICGDNDIFDNVECSNTPSSQQAERTGCPPGQSLCCNPVPGNILETRLGLLTAADPLGDNGDDGEPDTASGKGKTQICEVQSLKAVVNFEHGVACGKRDSRAYHQVRASRDEGGAGEVTNPGEWPWAVLIFSGNTYVGSGVLVDNNVVVTAATKVKDYVQNAAALTVRLGDFDPTRQGPNDLEDFAHVDADVDCVKLHPQNDYPTTLAYNVAILKLIFNEVSNPTLSPLTMASVSAASVVDIRSAPSRPGNMPGGVEGWRRNKVKDNQLKAEIQAGGIGVRSGLLANLNEEFDPLGGSTSDGGAEPVESFLARSYINTVCLPKSTRQFPAGSRCWVAAWGEGLQEQRELQLPLVSKRECEQKLRPEFSSRNVQNWDLHASELCAGGEVGDDACVGEGGAPLVCLDEDTDQFYALGLVGYGFGCGGSIPGVYTNLAEPSVKSFIDSAIDDNSNFC